MKNQNNFILAQVEKFRNNYLSIDPTRFIKTLKAFSQIFFVFSLLFLGTYIFKLLRIEEDGTRHFKLMISNIDILPLYEGDFISFIFISIYEVIKYLVIALLFFYFIKFLNSMDIKDPFKNILSKEHLASVAALSIVFFAVDAIGSIHLAYFQGSLPMDDSFNIFHFEYLFLAYFLNVFAVIFKRGVDLNNEIDLVI